MIVGSFWSLFVTSEDLVSKSTFQAILMHEYVNRLSVIKSISNIKIEAQKVVLKVVSSLGSGSEGASGSGSNGISGSSSDGISGSGLNGISGSSSDGISKSGSESISSEGCLKGDCSSEGSSESNSKSGSASSLY
ncbi:hypothetical protein RhiirC2_800175 [Rhizophagus irregularis]|uniref:Uncharacterized protein n=1 Tax=Rhizophagus irregularis TaxID=588596 RepID=A0A2N1M470_9GLOM|nr:hypothetical protein RhiirC2_800175 [Rhizophagus irregularis]